ncbi:MAG TPA: ABC transporter permease, partial [Candidatus Acidoferrales bacterium]|nr:ABC transporter permease [Candidatus Acidoferrales bacterium]
MHSFWQDLVYGSRMLRKQPTFTAIAVLTLALGIGANSALFSILDAFLLRPLAFSHPEQVTYFTMQQKGRYSNGFAYADYKDIQNATAAVFSNVAGFDFGRCGLTVDGKTQPIQIGYVTGNFFEMAGVRPAAGRFILPAEGAAPGSDPVLVLGYLYWKSRFNGDASIVGKQAQVNGRAATIIGVAPKDFHGIASMLDFQGYLPFGMKTLETGLQPDFMTNRDARSMLILARLRDGVTLQKGRAALDSVSAQLSGVHKEIAGGLLLHLWHLGPEGVSPNPEAWPLATLLGLFFGLALLVLVLACMNVANMMLVRALARRREMATRAALGAGRARLVRQVLAETLLLALLGGAAGVIVGMGASAAMGRLDLRTSFAFILDFHFDWRVFSYAFAAALLTCVFVGLGPALRSSKIDLQQTLREADRAASSPRRRLQGALVAAQIAGSMMLLVVAGLFTRSLQNVHGADLGFEPSHVMNLTMDPHEIGYTDEQGRQFYRQLLARVRALPGVQFATVAETVPLGEIENGDAILIEGQAPPEGTRKPEAGYNSVSSDYFSAMGIPLIRGRGFRDSDDENSLHVAVINQTMAQKFWPGADPIGRHFTQTTDPKHPLEIVGVVKDSKTGNLIDPPSPYYYRSLLQHYASLTTMHVRAVGAPESVAREVQDAIETIAPTMPVYGVQTMETAVGSVNGSLLFEFGAGLSASLGFLGLILATTGVYGVVSFRAEQRTREIGIRFALGAQTAQVLRMVCRQGFA